MWMHTFKLVWSVSVVGPRVAPGPPLHSEGEAAAPMCLENRSTQIVANSAVAMDEKQPWSEAEELKIRYYKAVECSTRILLTNLGSMVRDTFMALGFTSPQDYCRSRLGWSPSETQNFLSQREVKYLNDCGADTEYKLLTKVWREVGGNVVQKVEAQTLLLQKAIYEPPDRLNKQGFDEQIKNLLKQEKDLIDAVWKACHALLEEEIRDLVRTRKRKSSVFRKIMQLKEDLCFSSLSRAVDVMRWRYEEHNINEHWDQGFTRDLSASDITSPDFDYLLREVNSFSQDQMQTTKPLLSIKQLYINKIQRSLLPDIRDALNTIAAGVIGRHLFHYWRQELQDLEHDLEGRVEALGRSECSSYKAAFGAPLVDVHRWLLTRDWKPLTACKTSWNLVEHATGRDVMLQDLVECGQKPRVVIVYGPAGSGKTWLCHHLQEEWCSGRSSLDFLRELQLLVHFQEENIHNESFSRHLKNFMYPRVLAKVPDSEVIKSLCRFRVCFLMDASAGCKPEFTSAVREVLGHLGHNIAIITTRPEGRRDVRSAMTNYQAHEVYLQPLGDSQRRDLCLNYLNNLNASEGEPARSWRAGHVPSIHDYSLQKNPSGACVLNEDPNIAAGKFLQKLGSQKKDLFYPLPLAYLLWLWLREPRHLTKVTTVSDLFAQVIFVSEQMSSENTQFYSTEKAKKANEKTALAKLASLASEIFTSMTFPSTLSCRKDVMELMKRRNSVYQFLGYLYHPAQRCKTWHFVHPFLVEVLCSWDTCRKNTDSRWRRRLVCDWNEAPSSGREGSKYVTVTRLLCGFLCIGKDRSWSDPASSIVKLYKCVGVADDDFPAWVSLLREGAWALLLQRAVKDVMKSSRPSWRVPHANPREVEAVVELVTRRVYLPREVIIETTAPAEVIHMLARQCSIKVRILQAFQESRPQNSLLNALQGAGNVIEFRGEVSERGACALGRMTRLITLDIHLTSLAAIIAFSESVRKLFYLCDLHLHLDIDQNTPASAIPQMTGIRRHANVYLNLHHIEDSSYRWAAEVAKKLSCHRKEVYLNNSNLSPNLLQDIKTELNPTPVHISQ